MNERVAKTKQKIREFKHNAIIGVALKNLRALTGEAQRKISKRLGVKHQTYAKYESGEIPVNEEILQALSSYYKVPVNTILGGLELMAIPQSKVEDVKKLIADMMEMKE